MSTRVGQEVDRVVFDVEAGKIREFARATYSTDPVHTDPVAARAAGFDQIPATATHVVVAGHYRDQRAFVEQLGLDLARIVVGSVSWHYERPLQAGDAVSGIRTVLSDEVRDGRRGGAMRMITLETAYRGPDDEVAVRVREVLIERGGA